MAAESTVAAAAAIDGTSLLALQEDAPPRDRAARGKCAALLAALTRLQRALLRGSTDSALAELARIAAEPVAVDDPVLRGVLAGAALRARVELARHNRDAE